MAAPTAYLLLLDGTMRRIGRMGHIVMGRGDEGTVLWGTMGQWDGAMSCGANPHYALRTQFTDTLPAQSGFGKEYRRFTFQAGFGRIYYSLYIFL